MPIAARLMVVTVSWDRTRHLSWACSHLCWKFFRPGWTQVIQVGLKINWDTSTWPSFAPSKQIQWDTCALNHSQPALHVAFGRCGALGTSHLRIHLVVTLLENDNNCESGSHVIHMISCLVAHKGLKKSPPAEVSFYQPVSLYENIAENWWDKNEMESWNGWPPKLDGFGSVGTCFGLGPTDVDFDTHLGSAPWLLVTWGPGSFKRSCLDFSWGDSI